jgi:hypothetical protein
LSDRQESESHGVDGDDPSAKAAAGKKQGRKPVADVGRALRSVYDDTLRESVPNDFLDLLGKLN